MVEEDPVEENILFSAPNLTSLTQDKALRGDIMCCGFYARGTDLILDVCITDADNLTNKVQPVENALWEHERRKKNLYLHNGDTLRRILPHATGPWEKRPGSSTRISTISLQSNGSAWYLR